MTKAEKLNKLLDIHVWNNPICHVQIKTNEKHKPDMCRFMDLADGDKSVYAKYRKVAL